MYLKPISISIAVLAALSASAAEFVVNGDFEGGNTGFTSNYGYIAPNTGGVTGAAQYTVDDNPLDNHGSWSPMGDHTSGTGQMQIVNGSTNPADAVWSETVTGLQVGALYTFSAWASSVYPTSPAQITMKANDDSIDDLTLSATIGSWSHISGTWIANSSTATLNIYDLNGEPFGNDFALDDVSFVGPVPEPASICALAAGGLGLIRRRRASR